MSAIKEALSMIGYNSMGMTEAEIKIIKDLIKELARRDKVIEVVKEKIADSYFGHEEVNLTLKDRTEIESALSQLEDKP